ncbi:copper homeostasis protein CutC, partial [Pseudomonas aeruginosa]|uniref:copper homeostasis protein CutC n=1 Tax=Pseudomonas aeruginosa TaxID=287 RepID=UPI0027BB01D6
VHPIVRPRGGDFCYTEEEFAAMLNDIRMVRDLGFPGLVTGVLDADGQVDIPRMKKIMAAAGPLAGTFYRAVGLVGVPPQAREKQGGLGGQTILAFRSQSHR